MLIFDRYIGRTVLLATLLVLIAVLGLATLFSLVEELKDEFVTYTPVDAAYFTLLTTPRRIYEVLPYVVFLGCLLGLGSLAARSELVILRMAGVSKGRLFVSLMVPALLTLLGGAALGEWIAPQGEEAAEELKMKRRMDTDIVAFEGGYWYREGGLFMNIEGLGANGELRGLRQYWFDDERRLVRSRTATRGVYVEGEDPHWVLYRVVETEFDGGTTRIHRVDERRWAARVDPRVLSMQLLVDPHKLSIEALFYKIDYLQREGLKSASYELALWSKLLQPVTVLGLVLLALGFVIGPLREVGIGIRLSVGLLAGLGFKYLQDLFAPMSAVYELPALLAVVLPVAACWVVGWFGVSRAA